MREKPLILVVDDLESNLRLTGNVLIEAGYEISLIVDGKKAIEIAKKVLPDLILLDLVMPDTDGFEVCRQLQDDTNTKEIPIIFLTSMKNTENIVKGLEIGAVDYIVKPAKKQETLARIKTHLDLRRSKETILIQNKKLKELIDERNAFFSISSNQMMNPINAIRGHNDSIKSYNVKHENSKELAAITNLIDNEIKTVSSTVNDILYLYNLEQGNLPSVVESFNMKMLIEKVIESFKEEIKVKRLILTFDPEIDRRSQAFGDKDKVEMVLSQILSNAIKYSKFYKTISIRAVEIYEIKKYILVEFEDNGVGMSPEDLKNIFNKYSKLSPVPTNNEQSVGIGMPIVKRIIDNIGGKILIKSREEEGTTIKLFFPAL
jgi:two-component system sensor histidine kinase/response regulator